MTTLHIDKSWIDRITSLFLLFLFIGLVIVLTPLKVYADDTKPSIQDEYLIWRSYSLLRNCSQDSFPTTFLYGSNQTMPNLDQAIINSMFNSGKQAAGRLYVRMANLGDDTDRFECQNLKHIKRALNLVGFSNLNEFYELVKSLDPSHGTAKLNDMDNIPKKDAVMNKILEKIKNEKHVRGNLISYPEVQYYLYTTIFYDSVDRGGCTGNLSNQTKPDKYDFSSTLPSGNGENNYYYFADDEHPDKGVQKFKVSNYQTDKGIEGIDGELTSKLNLGFGESPSCEKIIGKLRDHTLADAYLKAVNDNPANKGQIKSSTTDGEGGGDSQASCEERTKLSSGWLVCSAFSLLSNGMEAMLGYVDDMLNVDVADIDQNPSKGGGDHNLKTSWSYFRAIATFMLVAVGLVMIIGQAIGGGS